MNRKSRASIAVVTATVLIGAGATAVANAVASSQAAKDAVSVESSAPKDTTAGTPTADLERSVNDLLARLSGLQAAVAAGAHGPGTPSPAETSEAVGASVETPAEAAPSPSETAAPTPTDSPSPTKSDGQEPSNYAPEVRNPEDGGIDD